MRLFAKTSRVTVRYQREWLFYLATCELNGVRVFRSVRTVLIELLNPIADNVVVTLKHPDEDFVFFLIALLPDRFLDDHMEVSKLLYRGVERLYVSFLRMTERLLGLG